MTAVEHVIVAMKPFDGGYVENALRHGVAGLNIEASRIGTTVETWPVSRGRGKGGRVLFSPGMRIESVTIGTGDVPAGRWPANVVHDGSPEVVAKFPQSSSGASGRNLEESSQANFIRLKQKNLKSGVHFGDSGSAARFFFVVKEFDSDGC